MANLSVQEERTASIVDGEQTFTMQVSCTDAGDLPDTGIFLFQVYNDRNPLADIFQRVVTVADLETYKASRTEALLDRETLFRSSIVTLTYSDVEVANQAVTVIKDRINSLVSDWETYYDSFKTEEPEVIDFPVADPAYVDSLKTAYSSAVTAYDAAVVSSEDAKSEYDAASDDLTAAQDSLTEWTTEYNRLAGLYDGETLTFMGLVPEMLAAYNLYHDLLDTTTQTASNVTIILTFLDTFFSDPGHQASFPDFYTAYLAFKATYQFHYDHKGTVDDGNTDHQTQLSNVSAILLEKQGDVKTAETTLNTKKASYIEAQATTQEAYNAVISAYEAVKAVCPSWSPSPPLPSQP